MKTKKKKTYIKLFNIPDVANRALAMLAENPPQTYSEIASKLGCDRSSVIHFHKKKIQENLDLKNFNGVQIEIIGGIKPQPPEVLNTGREYKDYFKKYSKQRDKLQAKQMKKAKQVIDKIHKKRTNIDVVFDFEIWDY